LTTYTPNLSLIVKWVCSNGRFKSVCVWERECVCACVCVRAYACECVCVRECKCACLSACVWVRVCVRVYVRGCHEILSPLFQFILNAKSSLMVSILCVTPVNNKLLEKVLKVLFLLLLLLQRLLMFKSLLRNVSTNTYCPNNNIVSWLKSTLLPMIGCWETHICMKT